MKLWNETYKWNSTFFFFFDVELWLCENLIGQFGWLSLFFLIFNFCLFKFGCPHIVLPCVLHAALITNFFFFWVLLYNHNNVCVLCVCGLCVVYLCVISVFVFGGCVCVLGWACWWVCCVFTYYPSFNFGIETWKKTI